MTKKQEFSNNVYALSQLTKRNMKLFLKDKADVFFSMLAPLILLLLYILFLSDIQVNTVLHYIPQNFDVPRKVIESYVDSWLLVGVLSVSCVTVSLSANSVMVNDKTKGIMCDGIASPVKNWAIQFSYFIFNFIVTVVIVCLVFCICMIYLVASGEWTMSATAVLGVFGNIIFSSLSSTIITVFFCQFIKSQAVHGAVVGIVSAVLGFLIGVYMPMSIMPEAAQYISALIPGSHSGNIFRELMMTGALENLNNYLPKEAVNGIANAFAMKMNFFGEYKGADISSYYLLGTIALFFVLNILTSLRKTKRK